MTSIRVATALIVASTPRRTARRAVARGVIHYLTEASSNSSSLSPATSTAIATIRAINLAAIPTNPIASAVKASTFVVNATAFLENAAGFAEESAAFGADVVGNLADTVAVATNLVALATFPVANIANLASGSTKLDLRSANRRRRGAILAGRKAKLGRFEAYRAAVVALFSSAEAVYLAV